jgi:hypothetical protein
MRGRVAPAFLALVQASLTDPKCELPDDYDPDTVDNFSLWNELVNAGDGMPERLMLQLPEKDVMAEHGLEVLRHIGNNVVAASDAAAEVVTAWLTDPPVVTEGRKYLLAETLAEWRRQLMTAEGMDSGLTPVPAAESVPEEAVCQAA